jgi:hypothetical protein
MVQLFRWHPSIVGSLVVIKRETLMAGIFTPCGWLNIDYLHIHGGVSFVTTHTRFVPQKSPVEEQENPGVTAIGTLRLIARLRSCGIAISTLILDAHFRLSRLRTEIHLCL